MSVKDLNVTLKAIAADFNLDSTALIRYAREDTIRGQDKGNLDGTAFTNDGKLLYALVRLLKPQHILEIGTYRGGSVNHLAAAVIKNGGGHIVTVDIWQRGGEAILDEYQDIVAVVHENSDFFLERFAAPAFDFIFEDGPHSEHSVHNIYQSLPRVLEDGSFILSHDTDTGMREYINNGMRKGGADMDAVRFYSVGLPVGMSVYRFVVKKHIRPEDRDA